MRKEAEKGRGEGTRGRLGAERGAEREQPEVGNGSIAFFASSDHG